MRMLHSRIRQETPFMASIPLPDLLTVVYVLVDDWYQTHTLKPDRTPPGRKPALSVSGTAGDGHGSLSE